MTELYLGHFSRFSNSDHDPHGRLTANDAGEFGCLPYFGEGDYNGSLVERSNRQAFIELFPDGLDSWYFERHEFFSTRTLIFVLDEIPGEAIEVLNGLSEYPLLDDEHYSDLQETTMREDWNDFGRDEVVRECGNLIHPVFEAVLDALPHQTFDALYDAWMQEQCKDGTFELEFEGTTTRFRVDDIAEFIIETLHMGSIAKETIDPVELFKADPRHEGPWCLADVDVRRVYSEFASNLEGAK